MPDMCQSLHWLLLDRPNAYQQYVHCVRCSLARNSCKSLAVQLPAIPVDAFRTCTASGSFRLQLAPHAIGVVFGGLFGILVVTVAVAHGRPRQTFPHSALSSG